MTKIHIIPTLEDNYTYVIETHDETILIDCGDAAPVISFLKDQDSKPTNILLTHHHWDHIDGLPDLKSAFPDMNIYGPEKDRHRIPLLQTSLADKQELEINGISIKCIETPGHTQNHLCYYLPKEAVLFSGDCLFSMGCGRLFEGTYNDLFYSMERIRTLPPETQIYCGHEYTLTNAAFSLSIEPDNKDIHVRKQEAEILRNNGQPTLPVSLETELKTNLFLQANTVEKIAQLRQLRDKF